MEDPTAFTSSNDAENLFDSVMNEFKYRIKVTPPIEITKDKLTPSGDKNQLKSADGGSDAKGITEYAAYCRKVGSPTNELASHYHTLPVQRNAVTQNGNSQNGIYLKPLTPPMKPKRRKKPTEVNGFVNKHSNTQQPSSDLGESRISTELQEIIESAFRTDKTTENGILPENVLIVQHRTPEHNDIDLSNDQNTLTRNNTDNSSRKSRSSTDSYLDNGIKTTKPISYIDDSDDFDDDMSSLRQECTYASIDDPSFETASMYSALSDEENPANVWVSGNRNGFADSISLSSFASADVTMDGKVNARGGRNKTRGKFKKHAAAQKERMGALIDAAAVNASDRIKKLRKPSIRFPHGKAKKLQNLANKIGQNKNSTEQPVITNISSPMGTNGNMAENEDTSPVKKPLPPLREGSLTSPVGHSMSNDRSRQMAIKSGFLRKQGGMIKTWNERWFVLKGDQLHYYKDMDGKYIASIFLPGSRIATHPVRANDTHKYLFEIFPGNDRARMTSNHESYILSANSQTDMDEWVKVIRRVILSPFGGGIFGQRLDETMRYDRRLDSSATGTTSTGSRSGTGSNSSRRQAPIIVENCVEFIRCNKGLTEEGLFRLPGHANEVKELQDAYDMGERPVFPSTTDVHTVASLLKGYLRELPEPVIPFERYDPLISAAKLSQGDEGCKHKVIEEEMTKEKEEARKIIKEQLNLLPHTNFDLLRYLCRFLDEVQRHSQTNKMDISNLAMVFGPNIMRTKKDDPLIMMADATFVQHIMFQFIANHEFFFPDDDKNLGSTLQSLPDVAVDAEGRTADEQPAQGDAGIGTLTSTASPLGTLGLRHATDDSGTGSMGPTPENTNKRAPPVPNQPPPIRVKPSKPMRRKLSGQHLNGESLRPSSGEQQQQRKSLYDNVTASSTTGTDADPPSKYISSRPTHDWRRSNESGELTSERSSVTTATTGQGSYYVNNRTTSSMQSASPRSSTNAVAGSVGAPDSCHSSPADDAQNPRNKAGTRGSRRQRLARQTSQTVTDEESNTESVPAEDNTFSTLSSHRSSLRNDNDSKFKQDQPRSSSYPHTKRSAAARRAEVSDISNHINRLSMESGSDGTSSASSVPTVPSRPHRRAKKEGGSQTSDSQRSSKAELGPPSASPNENAAVAVSSSNRSSHVASSTAASVCSGPFSYKELEEQINVLKEEMQKQRQEHEKRSRMLEEHYIMKMRTSASALAPFTSSSMSYPPAPSVVSHPIPSCSSVGVDDLASSPTHSNVFQPRASCTDDSVMLDSYDMSANGGRTPLSRTLSSESQTDIRYRDELKRHAMTKIRLRNAERGLQQAEVRNMQLQKEMEEFFDTFGSMLTNTPA